MNVVFAPMGEDRAWSGASPHLALACLTVAITAASCAVRPPEMMRVADYLDEWNRTPAGAVTTSALATKVRPSPTPPTTRGTAALSVDEALALALLGNPRLRSLRLDAGAQTLSADVSGPWRNPVLSTEIRRAVDGRPNPWFVSAGLAFTVPLSGRLAAATTSAKARASVAHLSALAAERRLRAQIRGSWASWSLKVRRVELLNDYVRTLSPLADIAEKLGVAGELPLAERHLLPIERDRAILELTQAKTAAKASEQQLRAGIGLAPRAAVDLVPTMDPATLTAGESAEHNTPAGWPAQHIQVQLARAGATAAHHEWMAERALSVPELTLGPVVEWDGGRTSLGLGLSVPLPFTNSNGAQAARGRGRRDLAQGVVETTIRRLAAREEAARRNAAVATKRIAGLLRVQTLVDKQLGDVSTLAKRGEVNVLLVRHALRQSLDVRVELAQARASLNIAMISLNALYEVPAKGGIR